MRRLSREPARDNPETQAAEVFSRLPRASPRKGFAMLLWREKIRPIGCRKAESSAGVLVDHAHLERKAATTALIWRNMRPLPSVQQLNAIAIEELQHFDLVLNLLKPGHPFASRIKCLYYGPDEIGAERKPNQRSILTCCALIEGGAVRVSDLGRELESIAASWRGLRKPREQKAITTQVTADGARDDERSGPPMDLP